MSIENVKDKLENCWIEKYRPKCIEELAVSKEIKMFIENSIEKKDFPNILLYGEAGTGKNSITNVLLNSIDCNSITINASSDNGIDVIREQIETFAKASSWGNKLKVVILNEADGISYNGQNALKEIMENSLKNCRFIITTNNYNKINKAIISRCTEFKVSAPSIEIAKRLVYIFDKENIEFEKEYIISIIRKYNTNIRKMIGESYKYFNIYGNLKDEYVNDCVDDITKNMFDSIFKAKNIKEINSILNKTLYDNGEIYTSLKKYCVDNFENPAIIITVMDYAYKSNIVNDVDLCFLSCLLEIKSLLKNTN